MSLRLTCLFRATVRARVVTTALALGLTVGVQAAPGNIPPREGPHRAACTSVEQDFSRLQPGESANDYWSGVPSAGRARYITDLLTDTGARHNFTVTVPTAAENDLWDKQAGKRLSYAALVCYPTPSDNTRADYRLPNGARVPRMQRGDEVPVVLPNPAQGDGRWPLIVFSHGLGGSPLGAEYLAVIERFVQEGYVVYAPFHGDARFSRTKVEEFGDLWFLLTSYGEVAEMQALRALSLKAGLDALLDTPVFRSVIDPDQIVGFGASLGGMGMMLVQGAKITKSWSGSERPVVRDERYKAVVGYVPFSGYPFLAAFGEGNGGVRNVRTPYLAIAGTADTVAPLGRTSQMVEALAGHRTLVVVDGMPHGLREQDVPELFGWTFAFFRAMLSRDAAVRADFYRLTEIAGPSPDRVAFQRALEWGPREEAEAIEFVSDQGKYFFTARANEIALLDRLPALWRRTGQRFVVFRSDAVPGQPMCRIRAFDGAAINTHFHSTSVSECALLLAQPWAASEGIVLRADVAVAGRCPSDRIAVHRLFNPATINHRYLSERGLASLRPGSDWAAEGVVFCAFDVP